MSGVWLGIDYGTSNTVAVLRWPDGRTRPLLFDSSPLLPSAVYASGDGRLIVGRDAERSARSDPARFEQNPKRRVDDLDVLLGGHTYPVIDLIAAVLRHVGDEARRTAGAAVGRISMTHPVTWGPARRRVLEAATARAGLPAPLLVPEPVAAAAYFTSSLGHVVKPGQSVVVYDLGAGTFDASVVRRTPAGFDTLAYSGLDDVGGLDLDAVMVQMIIDVVDQEAPDTARRLREPGTGDERRQRIHLWQDARQARETLSRESSVTVYPAVGLRDVLITRNQFEAAAAALLERTIRITTATVKEARVRPDDLAGWFLVGGATRTPLVATLLHRQTGQAATVIEEPAGRRGRRLAGRRRIRRTRGDRSGDTGRADTAAAGLSRAARRSGAGQAGGNPDDPDGHAGPGCHRRSGAARRVRSHPPTDPPGRRTAQRACRARHSTRRGTCCRVSRPVCRAARARESTRHATCCRVAGAVRRPAVARTAPQNASSLSVARRCHRGAVRCLRRPRSECGRHVLLERPQRRHRRDADIYYEVGRGRGGAG
ncbi:Hsp70 family protein [Dactylosporangium darangshiense]|uniref:Hsp70 family protein n=1 Tax=Dactylosporangium darangshiense TaxID=579108 RepID=UPI003641DF3C